MPATATYLAHVAVLGWSFVAWEGSPGVASNRPPTRANPSSASAIDPFLFDEIAQAAERASAAEFDPTRGPSNALEILRSRRTDVASDPSLASAIDLRIAGVVLRARFLSTEQTPEPQRWVQALSTFSRLDLADPGLTAWLTQAAERNGVKPPKPALWPRPKIAILTRGDGLDRADIARRLVEAWSPTGVVPTTSSPAQADFVLKVSSEDASEDSGTSDSRDDRVDIRVMLDIEGQKGGRVVWRDGLFRTTRAKTVGQAIDGSLKWLMRIGGRDAFFRWLGETKLPQLLPYGTGPNRPATNEREGHNAHSAPDARVIAPVGESVDAPLKVQLSSPPAKQEKQNVRLPETKKRREQRQTR